MSYRSRRIDDSGEPKCTFATYMAKGEMLAHKGEYIKAIDSFSTALSLQPGDKNCLVARSRCYFKMGDAQSSLKDAETSIKDDKVFFPGVYQKAEALYLMGEFEFALVYYHRGHKLRPEQQKFRRGIQKAEEAINNSLEGCSPAKLMKNADLSLPHKSSEKPKQPQKKIKSEKTARHLRGHLYSDWECLAQLRRNKDLLKGRTKTGNSLQVLITDCISYIDTRAEFWRLEKPIEARERDHQLLMQQGHPKPPSQPTQYILNALDDIDKDLNAGKAESSLKKATELLITVKKWKEEVLPNKTEIVGILHSSIGNAYLDLGNLEQALSHHNKDLDLAKRGNLPHSKSRALDNIGTVYTHMGKFQKAIETWEERDPSSCGDLEKAWLFHEIGCCYLVLQRYKEAQNCGTCCLEAAETIQDEKWQLNANMLVAQAELKLSNYSASVAHFEKALELASLLQDDSANETIQKALQDAKEKIDI